MENGSDSVPGRYSTNGISRIGISDTIPMHPDDFHALLAWIRAKRPDESFHETPVMRKTYRCLLVG
jgi:hypothetical protein